MFSLHFDYHTPHLQATSTSILHGIMCKKNAIENTGDYHDVIMVDLRLGFFFYEWLM